MMTSSLESDFAQEGERASASARLFEPSDEFFRREWRRTTRWLFRGPAVLWLVAYLGVLLAQILVTTYVRPSVSGYGTLASTFWVTVQYGVFTAGSQVIAFFAWVETIHSRTFNRIRGQRGEELSLTRLDSGNLWPTLLLGPILLRVSMSALAVVIGFLGMIRWLVLEGSPDPSLHDGIWLLFRAYALAVGFVLGSIQIAAATAWAVRLSFPGGDRLRLAIRCLGVTVAFGLLNLALQLLSQAVMFGGITRFFSPALSDLRTPMPYDIAFLPGVVVRCVIFLLLFRSAVLALRTPRYERLWREHLDRVVKT